MTSPLIEIYKNKLFIFPKKNDIPWSQDFHYYANNIPYGVPFTIDRFLDSDVKRVILRGKGYGELNTHDPRDYGCGSIFCDLPDILPYMQEESKWKVWFLEKNLNVRAVISRLRWKSIINCFVRLGARIRRML